MILLLAIYSLALTALGYCRAKSYIAPTVLAPMSWGVILLMYALFDHGMDEISNKTLVVLFLWISSISIGAWFFSEVSIYFKEKKNKVTETFNPTIRQIYYLLAIFGSIPLFYMVYKQGTTMNAGGFLFNLRMANTGIVETEYDYGIWQYAFVFAYVSLLIELYCYKKGDSKCRIILLVIFNILQGVATMAKSSFFFLILAIGIVYMMKIKIKLKFIIIGMVALVALMSSLQLLRSGNDDSREVLSEMFYVYTLGGVPALDQIVGADMSSENWGQMTMRFFNTVGYKLGLSQPIDVTFSRDITTEGYVYVPLPTNVYTVIGPFWWDFGFLGVCIFGFILGALCGWIYRLALNKELWGVIAYAYLASVLVLQFFGEYIFTNLSYTIQIIILSELAYKFNYVVKWRK